MLIVLLMLLLPKGESPLLYLEKYLSAAESESIFCYLYLNYIFYSAAHIS